jgi:phytoene desaturase
VTSSEASPEQPPEHVRTEPSDSDYDVVVIGSGLGGVCAAALLAKGGKQVLLVERGEGPGGYAHAFTRGSYTFDPAVHLMPEAELVENLFDYLGLRGAYTLIALDHFYTAIFPEGFRIEAPFGHKEFVESHVEHFPHEEQGIREFLDLRAELFRQVYEMPTELSLKELDAAMQKFPLVFEYRMATTQEVLDQFITDPRVKGALGAIWPIAGLPPSKLAFQQYAPVIGAFLDGSYYCKGSFQKLVDAFVEALEQVGGELIVRNGATRILVDDGHVSGVELASGRRVSTRTVVSNADAFHTFDELVGEEQLPRRFLQRLRRLRVTLSTFAVYVGTDQDLAALGGSHEMLIYPDWDHDRNYEDLLEARPTGVGIVIPSMADPSLAPPGEHAVIVRALAPYDIGRPWEEERERYTDALLDLCEQVFPGFREHVKFSVSATPHALERFTGNYRGASYGWESTPDQLASSRIKRETPVGGLYLAGAWTEEGPGALRVLVSGITTARVLLARDRVTLPDFKPPVARFTKP